MTDRASFHSHDEQFMTDRITALEEKHAFLEHQVEQLDGVIRELYDVVEGLRREIRAARAHIDKVETRLVESLAEDEPAT
jgi:uncharacterized coiled-coil protein SlyX